MNQTLWNRKFLSIRYKEYVFILGFYFFFASSYYTTLWFNRQAYKDPNDPFFSFYGFSNEAVDYLIKLILVIPIWWVLFRKLKGLKLSKRLALHILLLPLFTLTWQKLFYLFSEYFNYGHLQGSGQVWDIYIPGLFYILQFGIFHAYEYYNDNQNKLKLEAELRESLLKSELSTLKAQLNPHFLYNVFNTISASVPPEQEKTREMIANLADLFRYQLRASQVELVPLKDELNFVRQYLELEKARFIDRLEINIDVNDELLLKQVPPMILQPIVENAIKHGISESIFGGKVTISINKKGEKLYFEIADTGVGIVDKSKLINSGVGITNTKLRLEKMYNTSLMFEDNYPSGLKVMFSI